MAEAHSVAALSVSLTHNGISVSYDQELLQDIWHSFARAYKRRIARFQNNFFSNTFPANAYTIISVVLALSAFSVFHRDLSFGIVPFLLHNVFSVFFGDGIISHLFSLVVCGAAFWFIIIQSIRLSLKAFLSYKGWLFENPHFQKVSTTSKIWLGILYYLTKSGTMLHSFQGALPHLPLPSLDNTLKKHLTSMRPLCTDEKFAELVRLSDQFQKGVGVRLQRYLYLKSLFSINYVSDWWEEFVYLRQRSPIMVNSNYYGMDTIHQLPTHNQCARAASITAALLNLRRLIEHQQISPFSFMARLKIPFCSMQYDRLFNTCRIPGEEADYLAHWNDAKHIAVLCNGCWYQLIIHNGKRLHTAAEIQRAFKTIMKSGDQPEDNEQYLAALTAGDRKPWAKARQDYFALGTNKHSLDTIEQAAFVMILENQDVCYDSNDSSKFDHWAHSLLHGDGSNRWFDKSFNIIAYNNAHIGFNVEHSWGDATVFSHLIEYCAVVDLCQQAYDKHGNTLGSVQVEPKVQRLRWQITPKLELVMMRSLETASNLIADVEMSLLVWKGYGKGLIKKLLVSPDAFLQFLLQLTYYRNQGKFALTYEATTTRLYREGRTETVRSCTTESCAFVEAMLDSSQTWDERARLLRIACARHQDLYREAMVGQGVDRHLFGLYIVSRFLEVDSPFLKQMFPPTFLLSTSQTPINQCENELKGIDPAVKQRIMSAGGGFGPVADRGYGVSYMITGENFFVFHISSKKSAANTSSVQFRNDLVQSLKEMQQLLVD